MPVYLYKLKSWTLGDVVAGVTVAATSLPQYIAYAELAGLSGSSGIMASGPPQVAFAFITGSPCLCISVTSICALMASSDLRGAEYKEAYGEEAWSDLLGAYAFLVGLASLALAVSGAARLAGKIPEPVKAGWKVGFAAVVVVAQTAGAVFLAGGKTLKRRSQLPQVNGKPLSGGAASCYQLCWALTHPHEWDLYAVLLAALTYFIVVYGKAPMKKLLGVPGLEVLAATVLGVVLSMSSSYPGDVVGMPAPAKADSAEDAGALGLLAVWVRRWPWEMPLAAVVERLGGLASAVFSATAFASINFLAIISVEAEKPPEGGWVPGRELSGQAVACVVSGMAGSAPAGGSLSRSMVAGLTGATSPLMGLVCGLCTLMLAIPQVASLLAPTPKAVLAAICLAAVLPTVLRPKDVLKLRGLDAFVAWSTTAGSLLLDPTLGFGIGLGLYAVAHPLRGKFRPEGEKVE